MPASSATGPKSNQTSANESKTAPGNSRNSTALMPERLVRFRQTFFNDLDSLLPDERGRDGRPSATDFLRYELPRLRDQLAADFETNTLAVAGAEPLRVLI